MKTIELYLEKAGTTLEEADFMQKNGFYQGCVSRAYYAAFYAVQAALESKNVNAKTHRGALAMFSQHFIKTEILPVQTIKFLKETLDKRLLGDYEIGFKAQSDDAKLAVEYAEAVIDSIKAILKI